MILPALLTTNPRIAQERINLAKQMSGWLHIDLLDRTLYDFDSLPLDELQKLDFGDLLLEVHCMTEDPLEVIESSLPIERLTFHYEIPNRHEYYNRCIAQGVNTWLALDPRTDIETIELPDGLAGLMVMDIVPGQSGQSIVPDAFDRLNQLRDYFPDIALTIDGGVNEETARQFLACGVDNMVVGSAIFQQSDPLAAYERLANLTDPVGGMRDR